MKLPAAEWTKRRGLQALFAALDGQARYVGGAVRDTLLGLDVKDVDLATPLLPEGVINSLKAANIKVVPTGIDHGTVTAVLPDGPIEITTLRRDVSTDGRRATVAFSEDWKEDAARRDFTINALFADPVTLEISDYFGGLEDLEARRIRFIGSAEKRIAEDYLRILRYFRFLARFGKQAVDEDAFAACKAAAPLLEKLSRERVADELLKLLATENPCFAVSKMSEANIFGHIITEVDADAGAILDRLVKREQAHGVAPDPIRRLVALLTKDTDKADAIAGSLRLSKKLQKAVEARLFVIPAKAGVSFSHGANSKGDPGFRRGDEEEAGLRHFTPSTIRAVAYWHGVEAARDRALLFGPDNDIATMLEQLDGWQPPVFPLTGGDLIAQGLEPGPEVSKELARLEREWVESDFQMEMQK